MKTWSVPLVLGLLLSAQSTQAQQRRPLVSPEVDAAGKVTFRLRAPKAEKVTLSSGELKSKLGNLPAMTKDDAGVWSVTIGPVPPGIYDYDFQVDGLTITDPSSTHVFGNRQGSPRLPGSAGRQGQAANR